jgi:hypothetical protein
MWVYGVGDTDGHIAGKSPKEDDLRSLKRPCHHPAGMTPGKFVRKNGTSFELADDKFVKRRKEIHELALTDASQAVSGVDSEDLQLLKPLDVRRTPDVRLSMMWSAAGSPINPRKYWVYRLVTQMATREV